MNKFWKLGMDTLLILFYINVVGALYFSVAPMFEDGHSLSPSVASKEGTEHFDPVVKRYARLHGLDWRFVYAMIEVESQFKENAISHAGAIGLMQVMPHVGEDLNILNLSEPSENVRAGITHFSQYLNKLRGNTLEDRIQMALAAYNGGIGHIYDAKILAREKGLDPLDWASLATVLPDLEDPLVYPLTRHGYCQGKSVVNYVRKIQSTYRQYQSVFPASPQIQEIQAKTLTQNAPWMAKKALLDS